MSLSIKPISAFHDNYIWAIVNQADRTMICVDPGNADPVLAFAYQHQLHLTHILLTHHHADHIGGVEKLVRVYPNASVYGPIDKRISTTTHPLVDGHVIHLESLSFKIIATPGHTSTHICYFEPNLAWLFCGDTLFSGGCGRVFDGTIEDLYDSLTTLRNLPDTTKVFCGHEYTRHNLKFAARVEPENQSIIAYSLQLQETMGECSLPSTIGLEKKINPFFRSDCPELAHFAQSQGLDPNDAFVLFKCLRSEKDHF